MVYPPEAIARTIFFELFPLVFVLRRLKNASSFLLFLLLFLDDDVVAVVVIIIILVVIIIIILVVKVFFPLNSKLYACLFRVNGLRLVSKMPAEFYLFSQDSISV